MLGDRDDAVVDFTGALNPRALDAPAQARALYDRGVALDELGRVEDAVGDYSAAIALVPKFAAALNNRANAYRRMGRLAQARADYEASIGAGNPRLEFPEYGLGQIAEALGRRSEALSHYRRALDANPQFALASERMAALGATAADAPVVLRPPGGAAASPSPTDDGTIHLHPPARQTAPARPARSPLPPPSPLAGSLDLRPAVGDTAGHMVQLGAWRSSNEASTAWNRLIAGNAALLTGLSPQVVSADIPGRGRYYRLRTGPLPSGKAGGLCAALAARHIACMIVRD
jgi:tetratricopeptide (TPR) repeat protein